MDRWERENLYNTRVTGVDFMPEMDFQTITVPKNTYAVFETAKMKSPICDYFDLLNLRLRILTEWMPEMGYQLAEAPELAIYHWQPVEERHVQVWLPIEKK